MANWRDKILEQFVPKVSKLSLVSDPDNLLTEEKMAVALRNQGFDILEFNDAIEFRYAYESQYRTIWDKGLKTELVVIIHTQEINLNFIPFDLLEAGKRFYFTIADIFPVFSPYILALFDKTLFDTLYSLRNTFPKERQGDNSTIDFLLRYVYKIDVDAIDNEIDFIKTLLHIHYNNSDLPLLYLQRLEYLFTEKRIFNSLPINSLLCNKDLFIEYLMEKHKEIIESSPEVQLSKGVNKKIKKIDAILEYLEKQDVHQYSNHKDWINIAWKFAHLASFVYQNDNSDYISRLEFLYSKINEKFENWLRNCYTGLRTIPPTSPAMVHHIPHYLAAHYHRTKFPIALIVIDGLALNQWITLRDSLSVSKIQFIENAVFAWIPTLTAVSRQSIFSGKSPYEFEKSIYTTESEESSWSLFWQNSCLLKQNIIYQKNIDKNLNIHEFENEVIPNKTIIAGLVLNKIDTIMHGMELGMTGLHNQIKIYGETGYLKDLIIDLLEKNFEIWITSDHGNTECIGMGRPNEASNAKSRGERVRVYKSEELLRSVMDRYSWSAFWEPIGLPKEYFPLVAQGNSAFLPENTMAISHGGISMQETIVPFIKVLRK